MNNEIVFKEQPERALMTIWHVYCGDDGCINDKNWLGSIWRYRDGRWEVRWWTGINWQSITLSATAAQDEAFDAMRALLIIKLP